MRGELEALRRQNAQLVAALIEADMVVAGIEAQQITVNGVHYHTTLKNIRAALADAKAPTA